MKTRKHIAREPSGRLSRSTEDAIDAVPPMQARRMRDAAARKMGDPEWGTELGRLFMQGKITPFQFEAGRRWSIFVIEYYRAVGAPLPWPPTAAAPDAVRSTDRDDPGVTTAEGKRIRERRLRVMAEMQAALEALGPDKDMVGVLRNTCEGDLTPVGQAGLDNLRTGLDRLARHWRLVR